MEDRNELSERELLAALAEGQRRSLRHARITSIVCLIIAALLVLLALITLPRAASALDRLDSTLTRLEGTMETLENIEVASGQLDSFIEDVGALGDAATQLGDLDIDTLNDGIREITQIDFDTLNKAIVDLSNVIEPLARFASLFN